jgi:hypothetical protein
MKLRFQGLIKEHVNQLTDRYRCALTWKDSMGMWADSYPSMHEHWLIIALQDVQNNGDSRGHTRACSETEAYRHGHIEGSYQDSRETLACTWIATAILRNS